MLFPGGSDDKDSAFNARRPGFNPWVRKIPQRRKWQPTPVFLPGKLHRQRRLAGYSPWGCKELDKKEQLALSLSCMYICVCVYIHIYIYTYIYIYIYTHTYIYTVMYLSIFKHTQFSFYQAICLRAFHIYPF